MFCPNCGSHVDDGMAFCSSCGTAVQANHPTSNVRMSSNFYAAPDLGASSVPVSAPVQSQPAHNAVPSTYAAPQPLPNQYSAPAQYPAPGAYSAPSVRTAETGELPMGWHNFLVKFALWAAAVIGFVNFITMLVGTQYGPDGKELMYYVYPSLKSVDIRIAFAYLGTIALAVTARFNLASYRKIGPILLYSLYGVNILIPIVYISAVSSIVGLSPDSSSMSTSIAFSICFLVYSIIFYRNRAHMFTN